MADTIRIKRRVSPGSVGTPTLLANAELAYNENDHTLYIGEGTGGAGGSATAIVPIGGQGLGSNTSPAMNGTATAGTANTYARGDHIHPIDTSRAPTASPTLTGTVTMSGATTVTAPTVTPGTDNSTKVATTGFVQSAISAVSSGVTSITAQNGLSAAPGSGAVVIGVTANGLANASLGTMAAHTYKGNNTASTATPIDVTAAQLMTDLGAAPLNSPSFTGTPTTQASPANGDNTLKLATTAFVIATRHDQIQPPNVDVPWGSKRITGLLDPSNPQDAATKFYVDGIAQGINAKASCEAATTANITLSAAQSIDGVGVSNGDRVLVKDQTTTSQNGIYVVGVGAWTRATDTDTWNELISAYTFIEKGTVNADSGWLCTVDALGTLGTTAVTWTQFSGAGQVTAGNGLTKTGSQIDVVGTTNRITVGADSIDIASTYIGQATISIVGSIVTGIWNGTTIGVAYGGTGATTLTGYVKGAGTAALTASATIPSTDISGLGTMATQNANAVVITGGTIDNIVLDGGTF